MQSLSFKLRKEGVGEGACEVILRILQEEFEETSYQEKCGTKEVALKCYGVGDASFHNYYWILGSIGNIVEEGSICAVEVGLGVKVGGIVDETDIDWGYYTEV